MKHVVLMTMMCAGTGADIAIVCKAFQVVERNKMFVFVLTCAKGLGIGVTELELQRVLKTDVDRAVKFQPSRKKDVPTLRTILASLDVDMSRAISSELLMRCEMSDEMLYMLIIVIR